MEIKNKAGETILTINADTLSGANLSNNILGEADLRYGDLRGADLSHIILFGADLYFANLRGADIRRANLVGANLYGADLYGADLRGADLRWANIKDAKIVGAKVYGEYTIISENGIMTIGYLGSRNDYTIFFNCQKIIVSCGCFRGTIDEFEEKVKETHGDNQYGKDYRDTIEYVKKIFGRR